MRNRCTKENPMPKDDPGYWSHEGAECYDTNYEGDVDYYRCCDCGVTWKVIMIRIGINYNEEMLSIDNDNINIFYGNLGISFEKYELLDIE